MWPLVVDNLRYLAVACDASQTFFKLPVWYKYLPVSEVNGVCSVSFPQDDIFRGAVLIGFGIVDILLRVAGMIAVGFVIYAGFTYITSQGEPDKTKKAKDTILNALIGLAIVLIAVPIVSFIGNRVGV